MSWHIVHLIDIAPTPWKNGGGITRELQTFPVHEQWHWRVSVAEVTQDGPFSRYEGIERWFAVLSGGGVRLRFTGATHELRTDSDPLRFDGGQAAECLLLDGPTRDFNLMVRRGSGRMERVHGERAMAVASGSAVALWSGDRGGYATFEGQLVQLAPHTLAWRHLEMGGRVKVEAADGLWMEIAE